MNVPELKTFLPTNLHESTRMSFCSICEYWCDSWATLFAGEGI